MEDIMVVSFLYVLLSFLCLASACVWASPPSVVGLCDCDQKPCVYGLVLCGH